MRGSTIDLIGLALLIAFFIAGFALSGTRRLILFGLAIVVGGSLGYAAEMHNNSDQPGWAAFFDALIFILDILAAMFCHFIFRLIWRR
jgi:hypothetical protein